MILRGGLFGILLVAGMLSLPTSIADAATGEIVTRGAANLPEGTILTLPDATLFLPDTKSISNLRATTLNGSTAHICEYEVQNIEVDAGGPLLTTQSPASPPPRCYERQDLVIEMIAGEHSGWLGVHPGLGSSLVLSPSVGGELEPSIASILSSENADGASETEKDRAERPYFVKETVGPHVLLTAGEGTATFRGHSRIKLMGPDVMLRSSNGATEFRTGDVAGSGAIHERTQRFLVVDFEAGEILIESLEASFRAAAPQGAAEWMGQASFTAESGFVRIGAQSYEARAGETITLDGDLSAGIRPTANAEALRIRISGEASALTVGSVRVSLAPDKTYGNWPLWLLVGAALSTGSAAFVLLKRKREDRDHGLSDQALATRKARVYEARAMEAASEGRWRLAANLYQKAISFDPSQAPALLRERGLALREAGDISQALEVLEQARLVSDDGEAEALAAECALRLGMRNRAELLLLDGLSRGGLRREVLEQIAHDPCYASVRSQTALGPSIEAAAEAIFGKESGQD